MKNTNYLFMKLSDKEISDFYKALNTIQENFWNPKINR